jgi:hypothetical protein
MAMTSLFGPTPAQIEEARRLQSRQEIAQEAQPFGVFAPLYAASRNLTRTGTQSLVSGLFPESQDPALREAQAVESIRQKYMGQNMTDPKVLQQMAVELGPVAPMAALRLVETAKKLAPERIAPVNVAPGASVIDPTTGRVIFQAPDREAMVKTPSDVATVAGELGFGVRPNLSDYTQQEIAAINNLLERRGIRRAEAGVPKSGEVKVTDIKGAQDIVATYTKAPQDRLSTVRQLRVSLGEVKQGTGAALPQLRRDLVKLVGDNQIGQGEVQQALGSIGIVGDAISGINQLFTGVPSAEKLKDVEKFITALETEHAKSYNRGRETANKVLSEAKLSPETVKTLIPPEYKTGREKKTSNFVEGKIYKDAKGNRARYVNGKWEPVQ